MRFKMNFNKRLKKLIVFTLVCSVFFAVPAYAAEKEETDTDDGILEYEEIKEKVLENNLQLKSSEISVKKLRNKIDDMDEDAEESIDALEKSLVQIAASMDSMDRIISTTPPAFSVEDGSGTGGTEGVQAELEYISVKLDSIKEEVSSLKPDKDTPDDADADDTEQKEKIQDALNDINDIINDMDELKKKLDASAIEIYRNVSVIAGIVKIQLETTKSNLEAQIDSLEDGDSTDALEDQLDLAEVNTEQAKAALVNSTQNLYILYHQLGNNLEQLEYNRALLQKQLEVAEVQVKYGLGTQSAIKDVKSSLLELDASRNGLEHQRDSLLLQMKGLLGLTYEDRLSLGELPQTDEHFIDSIDLEKDIGTAAENALSVKTKKEELDSSSVYGDRRKYELQGKENDAALALTKQYHTLAEAKDKLMLSESRLEDAAYKLEQGKAKYGAGLLSEIELKVLENDVKTKELEVRSNRASLFWETENYKAMKDGLL